MTVPITDVDSWQLRLSKLRGVSVPICTDARAARPAANLLRWVRVQDSNIRANFETDLSHEDVSKAWMS